MYKLITKFITYCTIVLVAFLCTLVIDTLLVYLLILITLFWNKNFWLIHRNYMLPYAIISILFAYISFYFFLQEPNGDLMIFFLFPYLNALFFSLFFCFNFYHSISILGKCILLIISFLMTYGTLALFMAIFV